MERMPRIFLSHSSKDQELAGLVVDLLRSALDLPAEAIRSTSTEGQGLVGGVETDRSLKADIQACEVFIGLISAASMESVYVLFELGARWGEDRHLLPLLVPGADRGLLRGPLSGLTALSCAKPEDLHQMVHEAGERLGLVPEKPATYQRRLNEILGLGARAAAGELRKRNGPLYRLFRRDSEEIDFLRLARSASTIDLQGWSLPSFLYDHAGFLEERVRAGCQVRMLIVSEDGSAAQTIMENSRHKELVADIHRTKERALQLCQKVAGTEGWFKLRQINWVMPVGLLIINGGQEDAVMSVGLRPLYLRSPIDFQRFLLIDARASASDFAHFRQQFESLWSSEETRLVCSSRGQLSD